VVTHQLQIVRGTGKVRRSKTGVLPLCKEAKELCYIFANYIANKRTNKQTDRQRLVKTLPPPSCGGSNVRINFL